MSYLEASEDDPHKLLRKLEEQKKMSDTEANRWSIAEDHVWSNYHHCSCSRIKSRCDFANEDMYQQFVDSLLMMLKVLK